jgi:hypothetical protein
MMWLGADFQAERKRQISLAKKFASSMGQFHKTKEMRRLRELVQADVRRRKLAAKIGREVRNWWNKLDKVIAFKQKMMADQERERAMNRRLVLLVQQTEKYTQTLSAHAFGDVTNDIDESEADSHSTLDEDIETQRQSCGYDKDGCVHRRLKSARKQFRSMTIEEALASENPRKSKLQVVDYARMKLEASEFYGESTASDASESDGSFSMSDESDETDDDSTLRAAMEEEIQQRNQLVRSTTVSKHAFSPDPEELRKLCEERTMDIEEVIQRLREESYPQEYSTQETCLPATKRVKFSESVREIDALSAVPKVVDSGEDSDSDGDASDVEDMNYAANDANSKEEHETGEIEFDDETAIAQGESLPKEVSYGEDIDLLKDVPKGTRKMYANMQVGEPPRKSTSEVEEVATERGLEDLTDEEEYVAGKPEMDDETTIAQEESMPTDVSYSEVQRCLLRSFAECMSISLLKVRMKGWKGPVALPQMKWMTKIMKILRLRLTTKQLLKQKKD